MQGRCVGSGPQKPPDVLVPQFPRNTCQCIQLISWACCRQEQQNDEIDGLTVDGVKFHRPLETRQHRKRLFQLLKPRVRNRNAIAETG